MQVGPGTSCTIITGSAKPEPKAQDQSGDAPSKLSTIKPVSVAPVRSHQSQGECEHYITLAGKHFVKIEKDPQRHDEKHDIMEKSHKNT